MASKGIVEEYYKPENIKRLHIVSCRIGNLDLSSCSSLTFLSIMESTIGTINLTNTGNLEQITMDHVSGLSELSLVHNTKLKELSITTCKDFKEIDLSNNVNLLTLTIRNTLLTNLDIYSKRMRLIDIIYNKLESFTYSSHDLEKLFIDGNGLRKLSLDAPNLTALHIQKNKIKTIDLAKYPRLDIFLARKNKLSHINYNKNIKDVDVSYNKLTDISLENLPLTRFICTNNPLAHVSMKNCPKVKELRLDNNQIKEISIENSSITQLSLSHNMLNRLDVSTVKIKKLFCKYNNLTSLILSEHIKTLKCSHNKLTFFDNLYNIKYLNCKDNEIRRLDLTSPNIERVKFINNPLEEVIVLCQDTPIDLRNFPNDDILPLHIDEADMLAYQFFSHLNAKSLQQCVDIAMGYISSGHKKIYLLQSFGASRDELIKHGFVCENYFALLYDDLTLRCMEIFNKTGAWFYSSLEHHLERGIMENNSSGLILFYPEYVYKQTGRAINNMSIYKVPTYRVLNDVGDDEILIRVSRYSKSASSGLFYTNTTSENFCGTFYFCEPDSLVRLSVKKDRFREYPTKTHALMDIDSSNEILSDEIFMSQYKDFDSILNGSMILGKFCKNYPNLTPEEQKIVADKLYYNNKYDAWEDPLDQILCLKGKELGIDVFVFNYVPGTTRINGEVLDTRSRPESFKSLVYPN